MGSRHRLSLHRQQRNEQSEDRDANSSKRELKKDSFADAFGDTATTKTAHRGKNPNNQDGLTQREKKQLKQQQDQEWSDSGGSAVFVGEGSAHAVEVDDGAGGLDDKDDYMSDEHEMEDEDDIDYDDEECICGHATSSPFSSEAPPDTNAPTAPSKHDKPQLEPDHSSKSAKNMKKQKKKAESLEVKIEEEMEFKDDSMGKHKTQREKKQMKFEAELNDQAEEEVVEEEENGQEQRNLKKKKKKKKKKKGSNKKGPSSKGDKGLGSKSSKHGKSKAHKSAKCTCPPVSSSPTKATPRPTKRPTTVKPSKKPSQKPSSKPTNPPSSSGGLTNTVVDTNAEFTTFGCDTTFVNSNIIDATTKQFTCVLGDKERGIVMIPSNGKLSIVDKIRVYAGVQECSDCDLVSYKIDGRLKDGDEWVLLSSGGFPWSTDPDHLFNPVNTVIDSSYESGDTSLTFTEVEFSNSIAFKHYRVTFAQVRDESSSMLIIGELELPGKILGEVQPTAKPTTAKPTKHPVTNKPTRQPSEESYPTLAPVSV